MASKTFLISLDLNKNELLNAVIQNLAAAPASPVEGQIYFNTTDHKPYMYGDGAWISIAGDIESVANAALGGMIVNNGNGPNVTLKIDVDDSSLELSGTGKLQIKALGITNSMIVANTVALGKLAQIADLRVLGNVSGAVGDVALITLEKTLTDDDTKIPTSGAVSKAIANALSSEMTYKGGYDAAANIPNLDGDPPIDTIKKGDMYTVTTAGHMFTVDIEVGDVIIANQDAATLIGHWTIVNKNIDLATETVAGIAELATQTEVTTGTDDTRIVTPLKLKEEEERFYHAKLIASVFTMTFTGNGIATEVDYGHQFSEDAVIVEVCDAITKETVITGVKRQTERITIIFNVPPAVGKQYIVTVMGNNPSIS